MMNNVKWKAFIAYIVLLFFFTGVPDTKGCNPVSVAVSIVIVVVKIIVKEVCRYHACEQVCKNWIYLLPCERNRCRSYCKFNADIITRTYICDNYHFSCYDRNVRYNKRSQRCESSRISYGLLPWQTKINNASVLNKRCGLRCGTCPECTEVKTKGFDGCVDCRLKDRCRFIVDTHGKQACYPATQKIINAAHEKQLPIFGGLVSCPQYQCATKIKKPGNPYNDCQSCVKPTSSRGERECAYVYRNGNPECIGVLNLRKTDTIFLNKAMCEQGCQRVHKIHKTNLYAACEECTKAYGCRWRDGRCSEGGGQLQNTFDTCFRDCSLVLYRSHNYPTRTTRKDCLACAGIECGFVTSHGEYVCKNKTELSNRMPWEYVIKYRGCDGDCRIIDTEGGNDRLKTCRTCTQNGCTYVKKAGFQSCRHANELTGMNLNPWEYTTDPKSCDCLTYHLIEKGKTELERCDHCTRNGCIFVKKDEQAFCTNMDRFSGYQPSDYKTDPHSCRDECVDPIRDDWVTNGPFITLPVDDSYTRQLDQVPIHDCSVTDVKVIMEIDCHTGSPYQQIQLNSYNKFLEDPFDFITFSKGPYSSTRTFHRALNYGVSNIKKKWAAFLFIFNCPMNSSYEQDYRAEIKDLQKKSFAVGACGVTNSLGPLSKEILARVLNVSPTNERIRVVSDSFTFYFQCINPFLSTICPQTTRFFYAVPDSKGK